MSRADLPVLASITALSLGCAVLTLEDGSSVTVDAKQPGVFASAESGYLLVGGNTEDARAYAVPDHLQATLCAALRLWSAHFEGPPVLTLLSFDEQPDTVTFGAVNGEGQAVSLTMPQPLKSHISGLPDWSADASVQLYVNREEAGPMVPGFVFHIWPTTPEGFALLTLLGMGEQFKTSSEGRGLN